MNTEEPNTANIECILSSNPAALERVMRVIRVRGFCVQSMNIDREGEQFSTTMELTGKRSIDNLIRQLEKLVDVERVRLKKSLLGFESVSTVGAKGVVNSLQLAQ